MGFTSNGNSPACLDVLKVHRNTDSLQTLSLNSLVAGPHALTPLFLSFLTIQWMLMVTLNGSHEVLYLVSLSFPTL